VQELAPGLWRWTLRHPEWHPPGFEEVASYAVRDHVGTVLIDPLVGGDEDPVLGDLDALVEGGLRIVVTIPYHVRSAEPLWRRYRERHEATIHGHPRVASRLSDTSGFRPLQPGAMIGGELEAEAIGRPRRAEMPVWLPSHRALAFGDAVIEVGGELRVWEEEPVTEQRQGWYRERYLPTLARLLDHDVERVLVTHGRPVLRDGARALQRALDLPPWSRRHGC
jgi:hypothetical protein